MKTERAIAEFIDYKQSLGRRYISRSIILRAFARVAGGSDIRKVTPEIVRKFIDGRGPVTNAWFARFSTLKLPVPLRPLKKLHRRFATAEIEAPETGGISSIHLFGGGRQKTLGCRGITASA